MTVLKGLLARPSPACALPFAVPAALSSPASALSSPVVALSSPVVTDVASSRPLSRFRSWHHASGAQSPALTALLAHFVD